MNRANLIQPSSPLGATCRPDGVAYCAWSPIHRRIEVEIERAGEIVRRVPLQKSAQGYHTGVDPEGRAGDDYRFHLDDGPARPDPASRWQPAGVHGPSRVVDPSVFRWSETAYRRPAFRDLVIYELHVGTFSAAGTFRGVIEHLPHLVSLGVNAIELLPIGDFPGERNWGYDGVCLYAPARCYGSPDDLRALVDAAHAAGLAVILDVVYNHFGPAGNYLADYVGDYLDETAKTPWGGAIRYGHSDFAGLRQLVASNPGYWMEEFRIDGFRFDATHAIFDPSPQHLLAELTEEIHHRGGYAIAEDSRNDRRLLAPVCLGGLGFDAVWADDFHHAVRVRNTGEQEAYYGDYAGSITEIARTLRDGWFYAGQIAPFHGKPRGTPAEKLPLGSCLHCLSNHDQVGNHAFGQRISGLISREAFLAASVLLCLSPHTPMLFMGQEWAASTPFLFFTDHEPDLGRLITLGRREEFRHFAAFRDDESLAQIPDPQAEGTFRASVLRWKESAGAVHAPVLALYRACLQLRRENEAFRPREMQEYQVEEQPAGVCLLRFGAPTVDWVLLVDFLGGHTGEVDLGPDAHWARVLSTREPRFGGDGGSGWAGVGKPLHFDRPEAVLLRRQA